MTEIKGNSVEEKILTYGQLLEFIAQHEAGKSIENIFNNDDGVIKISPKTYYNIVDGGPVRGDTKRKLKDYLSKLNLTFEELPDGKIKLIASTVMVNVGGNQIGSNVAAGDQKIINQSNDKDVIISLLVKENKRLEKEIAELKKNK
jgi:hypothetical protein